MLQNGHFQGNNPGSKPSPPKDNRKLAEPAFFSGIRPPSANWRTKTPKTCIFLGDFDPFRHISCLAEGGLACRICYTGGVFWPSANGLPWREGGLNDQSPLDYGNYSCNVRISWPTTPSPESP